MAKRSLQQIMELSANPHYTLSDEDLATVAEESRRQARISKKELEAEEQEQKEKRKKNKNQFDKTVGTFKKTATEE